jgi:hypothetical protein
MVTDHPPVHQPEELLHQQDHQTDIQHRHVHLTELRLQRDHLTEPLHRHVHLMDLQHQHVNQHQTFHLQDPVLWKVVPEVAAVGDLVEVAEVVEEEAEDDNKPGFFFNTPTN